MHSRHLLAPGPGTFEQRSDLPLLGFVLGIGVSGLLWGAFGAGCWWLLSQW